MTDAERLVRDIADITGEYKTDRQVVIAQLYIDRALETANKVVNIFRERNDVLENRLEFTQKNVAALQRKINTLFEAVAHGDEEHRKWLKATIEAHFA